MVELAHNATVPGGANPPPGFSHVQTVKEFNWGQHKELVDNLQANLSRNVEKVRQCEPHGRRMVLVGGGTSVADHLGDIGEIDGEIVAMNNSALFLNENGIKPWGNLWWELSWNRCSAVTEVIPGMRYLLPSHGNPRTFDAVPEESIMMWHCYAGANEEDIIARSDYGGPIICGGSAGILRAINIGYVMGYREFDIFGMDGSSEGETHAYEEDVSQPWVEAIFCGKRYRTLPYLAAQARDFWLQVRAYGPDIDIAVWGEGLVPDMARKLGIHAEQKRKDI